MAGGVAGAGKLGLKGFMAGGAAVELRFKETTPNSRPAKRERVTIHEFKNNNNNNNNNNGNNEMEYFKPGG